MITLRPKGTLYHVGGGWFSANWHFSFDTYEDPDNTWFGDLRVFNDDTLVPGAVWPMHPHRDIEGITYVAEGMFEHADSRGNGGILPPGSVQRATLGSGMEHSEGNHSQTEPMRFIQMWIIPARRGLEPSIEQRSFPADARRGRWLPVLVPAHGYGGPDAPQDPGAVTVHQDAAVYATLLDEGEAVTHNFRPGFGGYLFAVHGEAQVSTDGDAVELEAGGAAVRTSRPRWAAIAARGTSDHAATYGRYLLETRLGIATGLTAPPCPRSTGPLSTGGAALSSAFPSRGGARTWWRSSSAPAAA